MAGPQPQKINKENWYIYDTQNYPDQKDLYKEDDEYTFILEKNSVHNREQKVDIKRVVKNLLQFRGIYMHGIDPVNLTLENIHPKDRIGGEDLHKFFKFCGLTTGRPEMKEKQTYSFLGEVISVKQAQKTLENAKIAFYAMVYDKTDQYYRQYSTRLNRDRSLRYLEYKFVVLVPEANQPNQPNQPGPVYPQGYRLEGHNSLEVFTAACNHQHGQAQVEATHPAYRQMTDTSNYMREQQGFRVFVVGQNGYLVFCHRRREPNSNDITPDPILLTEFQYLIVPNRIRMVYRRVFNTQRRQNTELFLRETVLSSDDGMAVCQGIIQSKTGGDDSFVVTGIINAVLDMSYMRAMMHKPEPNQIKYKALEYPFTQKYHGGEQPRPRIYPPQPQAAGNPPGNP